MTINQEKLKSVCEFEIDLSLSQVTQFVEEDLCPLLEAELEDKIGDDFTDLVIKHSIDVSEQGVKKFQSYPAIIFSGETTVTREELNDLVNDYYDKHEDVTQTEVEDRGGTLLSFHTHRYP